MNWYSVSSTSVYMYREVTENDFLFESVFINQKVIFVTATNNGGGSDRLV